ncbi:hypothetical protein [Halopelagius longus]|uniref:Uncharacterized protein n=1 Tax=Halopelagius longus TaxID=1236180 RepID=A0A1H1BSK6_9EURY|nr:hypothetical protein [Halopelagius longus]RDI70907.1 hypothetical protein DWB78_03720 [Halopelagius longus]SDQ54934.1 hypothetical protein SAMN05216278_1932 [Halopelagius longus]
MARFLSDRTRGGEPSGDGNGVGSALRYVSLGVALGLVVAGWVARRYRSRRTDAESSAWGRPEETDSGSLVYVWRPTRDDVSPR